MKTKKFLIFLIIISIFIISSCVNTPNPTNDPPNTTENSPLKILNTKIISDIYGFKYLQVEVQNISNKYIKAFKLYVEFYDDFGDQVDEFYEYYVAQELNISPGSTSIHEWLLLNNLATSAYPEVVEVVFIDGTKWTK